MNKIYRNYLIIIIVIVSGYIVFKIWESDAFQSHFFPHKYWLKQVELAQAGIDTAVSMIRDTSIELEKLNRTADLEIAQAMNFMGDDVDAKEEARKITIEGLKQDREILIDEIKEWRKFLEEEKKKLEIAKGKVKGYLDEDLKKKEIEEFLKPFVGKNK